MRALDLTMESADSGVLSFIQEAIAIHTNDPYPTHPISPHGTIRRNALLPSIIIWDPLHQFFHGSLSCFECGSSLKVKNFKSGINVNHNPRVLVGTDEPLLLVGCVYSCRKDHRIVSHDQRILDMCEEKQIPFVLMHKIGFTKKFMTYVVGHVSAGLNNSIERTHSLLWEMNLHMSVLPCFELDLWRKNATRKTIALCFVYHYFLHIQKYNTIMSAITGNWLTMDHTFKTAANIGYWDKNGKWATLYGSVFLIMNEKKEVLSWVFTKTAGFIHVRHSLMKVKERCDRKKVSIHGLVIDNCCAWRALLEEIFGLIPVKLDLFHGVKRVTSTISKKHQFFHPFISDFRMVFRNPMDRLPERMMTTPSASEIMQNITLFENRWESIPGTPMNDKTRASILRLKKHIELGCMSDIPPGLGTNINENIHKQLNKKVSSTRKGVQSAMATFGHFIYNWNQKRSEGTIRPIELQPDCPPTTEVFGVCAGPIKGLNQLSSSEVDQEGSDDSHSFTFLGVDQEIDEPSEMESVLGIEKEEVESIKSWAMHCANVQLKFVRHPDLNLSSLVFWSQYLHHLFDIESKKSTIVLGQLGKLYGMIMDPAQEQYGLVNAALLSSIGVDNQRFQDHLKAMNLCQSSLKESSEKLKQDVILESCNYEYLYSHYFKVVSVSYDQWMKDLRANIVNSERLLLPAIANILQVPLLLLTDIDTFPIICVIPTQQRVPLPAECFVFIGYSNQLNQFYGLVPEKKVEEQEAPSVMLQDEDVACRCGQGRNRGMT